MSKIKRPHFSGPKSAQEVVRAYLNQMIQNQGRDVGLSPNGRRYAFVRVWAAIPNYRWKDKDGTDYYPIGRLADLIEDDEKRRDDRGLTWLGLSVESAVEEALARDFDRTPGRKKAPIVDSEVVASAEPLVDDPAEALEEAELREDLVKAIGRLGPSDQRVLKAAYWTSRRGRNIAKVRKIMGCVKSTAHKRISEITKSLARTLDKHK